MRRLHSSKVSWVIGGFLLALLLLYLTFMVRLSLPDPSASTSTEGIRKETRELAELVKKALKEVRGGRKDISSILQRLPAAKEGTGDDEQLRAEMVTLRKEVARLKEDLEGCQSKKKKRKVTEGTHEREAEVKVKVEDTTPTPPRRSHTPRKPSHRNSDGSKGIDELGIRETLEGDEDVIPVVVFAYKRDNNLRKALDRIFEVLGSDEGFRIFVSQDGTDFPQVTEAIQSYGDKVVHFIHTRNDTGATPKEKRMHFQAYYAIAHHYGWALREIFSIKAYQRVILLEEDLEVATDFFRLMQHAAPLLDEDPTLFCVSAWNDNGKADLVSSHDTLYRTDFFPGLGWMMPRRLWEEVQDIWPAGFWDDWLRQPKHRKGRSCLRPEVPRTFMWCDGGGVSKGQFCRQFLSKMKLDDIPVDWSTQLDPNFYKKEAYDKWLDDTLRKATTIRSMDEIDGVGEEYKMYYTTNQEFKAYASMFGLMTDFKDNVPRTAYNGIVTFRWRGNRVHLVSRLKLYD